jgi:hypothetical protein
MKRKVIENSPIRAFIPTPPLSQRRQIQPGQLLAQPFFNDRLLA